MLRVVCRANRVDHPANTETVRSVFVQADKALDHASRFSDALGPSLDPGKLITIKEQLAACEATPAGYSPGQAGLFLQRGRRGFHFDWFFAFRDTNQQDANSAAWLGSNSYRSSLDFLPDEFLDIGQVSLGFEFTPAGFVCRVNHRFVLSTGRW